MYEYAYGKDVAHLQGDKIRESFHEYLVRDVKTLDRSFQQLAHNIL